MKRARWLVLAAFGVAMMIPSTAAVVAQSDGTGGPEEGTPDALECDRALLDQSAIAAIADGTPGIFSGSLEPVDGATVAGYAVVDADTDAAVRALLVSYNSCVAKYGAAGAYAFLAPGIQTVELIYLGVFNPQPVAETPAGEGTPEGMAPVQRVPQLTPKTIVVLPDGRVGAVVAAPQAGTDEALVVLVQKDGLWLIERISPIAGANSTPGSGDGGGVGGP